MSEEEINITLKPSKGDNIPVTVDPSKPGASFESGTRCGFEKVHHEILCCTTDLVSSAQIIIFILAYDIAHSRI